MEINLLRFEARKIGQAALAKDGSEFVLEFEADEQRLWVTMPISTLARAYEVISELRRISQEVESGVHANRSTSVPTGER